MINLTSETYRKIFRHRFSLRSDCSLKIWIDIFCE